MRFTVKGPNPHKTIIIVAISKIDVLAIRMQIVIDATIEGIGIAHRQIGLTKIIGVTRMAVPDVRHILHPSKAEDLLEKEVFLPEDTHLLIDMRSIP